MTTRSVASIVYIPFSFSILLRSNPIPRPPLDRLQSCRLHTMRRAFYTMRRAFSVRHLALLPVPLSSTVVRYEFSQDLQQNGRFFHARERFHLQIASGSSAVLAAAHHNSTKRGSECIAPVCVMELPCTFLSPTMTSPITNVIAESGTVALERPSAVAICDLSLSNACTAAGGKA